MTAYLLDTNHPSAIMNGSSSILQKIDGKLGSGDFGVAMTSIGELWFMVYNSAGPVKNEDRLKKLLADLVPFEFDEESAQDFGRIKAELRRIGRPIPDPGSQIAAVARVNNLTVLTADTHFSHIPNLRTENWTS
jgi:tRNA(fMet)-specific endonuclease VapC